MKHIKIYQITNDSDWFFMNYDFAKKHGFTMNDYSCVYECDRDIDSLEEVYEEFNMHSPKDFKGHSLSVSDIVKMDGNLYYCDIIGWEKIK